MSWLSSALRAVGWRSVTSVAMTVAERAMERFAAYARTDGYESLYEFVLSQERTDLSGSEKLERALEHAASDAVVFGRFTVRAAIEAICGEIKGNE